MSHWLWRNSERAKAATASALKQRGLLTIRFDPDMVWVPPPTGRRGRQPQYRGEE